MVKLENPYSKILDEISDSISLHKVEAKRINRDLLDSKLEETVRKYVNDPMVVAIRQQKKISEDDQGYLDINIFSSTFYKNKLDISKQYEKEAKKFDEVAGQYKSLVQQRITKYELNASMLSKFTPEEIQKNPKLSKMMNDVPEGFESARKKFVRQDAALSKLYSEYVSKNGEEYAEKLFDFLAESKQFRKQFMAAKKIEIEELVEKPAEYGEKSKEATRGKPNPNLFGKSQMDFNVLREVITTSEIVTSDQLNELKTYISKVFNTDQLAKLNNFEQAITEEYSKFNSKETIVAKRLDISVKQFTKGVTQINDLVVERGTPLLLFEALNKKLDEEIFKVEVNALKSNPALINLIVGYAARIKKYISENQIPEKKGLFGLKKAKVDENFEKIVRLHEDLVNYLVQVVTMDPSIFEKDLLTTMITDDKREELGYALMNNASAVSNTTDVTDWQDSITRIMIQVILAMVKAMEEGYDPIPELEKFKDEYISKKEENIEEDNGGRVKSARTYANRAEQTSRIRELLK